MYSTGQPLSKRIVADKFEKNSMLVVVVIPTGRSEVSEVPYESTARKF